MYEKGISNTDNTFHDKIFDAISHGDADTAHKLVADILTDALSLINSRL
jgi:DNA-binding FadR family transcriptional regulator